LIHKPCAYECICRQETITFHWKDPIIYQELEFCDTTEDKDDIKCEKRKVNKSMLKIQLIALLPIPTENSNSITIPYHLRLEEAHSLRSVSALPRLTAEVIRWAGKRNLNENLSTKYRYSQISFCLLPSKC
jgi:hypothetical protein